MSEPCWASIQIAPWDETRTDAAFADLVYEIDRYGGFTEDEVSASTGGIVVRTLTDEGANYGGGAFRDIVENASAAGLWCRVEDDDGPDWPGSVTVVDPAGNEVFGCAVSHDGGPVAYLAPHCAIGDVDQIAVRYRHSVADWILGTADPALTGRARSKELVATLLARIEASAGGDEAAWELSLRYAKEVGCQAALRLLAANPDVPERIRATAAQAAAAADQPQ